MEGARDWSMRGIVAAGVEGRGGSERDTEWKRGECRGVQREKGQT